MENKNKIKEFQNQPHNNQKTVLYHGSKSGLNGCIRPISRELCDFGKGFYMGTDKMQPLTLICNFPKAMLYTLEVDLTNLNVLEMNMNIDWALLIAYHRGKMDFIKDSTIYKKYATMTKGYDMVVGYIANDRMFVVLDRFFFGDITDMALINSLSALKLGKQYVALTETACKHIKIIEEKALSNSEREALQKESDFHRQEGIRQAEEICRRYRRDGLFFDEIISEGV